MYRVLIVEDDPMVAFINRQYVESTPSFQVDGMFKSGIEALEYLEKEETDLIILDYYTPLMNGDEFIDKLHGMGKTPVIIMVTSANDFETVNKLLSRGVIDYLVKPFEYQRFKAALERFGAYMERMKEQRGYLKQGEIDSLLAMQDSSGKSVSSLSKGLNEATLRRIRAFLQEKPGSCYTSEQLAEQIGLSRITVRRYMNYLVEIGELFSEIDYQTGGRPSIKYRYIK